MTRFCGICETKLGFFHRNPICKHCQLTKYEHYLIGDNISKLIDLNKEQLTKLVQFGHLKCSHLYNSLFKLYLKNERLSYEQIEYLRKISKIFSLKDKTLKYEEKNKLEDLKNSIKKTNILPEINKHHFDQLKFELPEKERYFLSGYTNLNEIQNLSSYQSYGQKIVNRGPKLKSKGSFIVTWNTFYYIPTLEGRLLKIDLSKILKYNSDGNYLYIRKDGREKPYLFQMNSIILETCIIGLDFLFNYR